MASFITRSEHNVLQCLVVLETEVCLSPHTAVESLKVSLVKDGAKISQKKLRAAAVQIFRGRIERVIADERWHIEKYIVLLFCETLK